MQRLFCKLFGWHKIIYLSPCMRGYCDYCGKSFPRMTNEEVNELNLIIKKRCGGANPLAMVKGNSAGQDRNLS